jgi:hypothetical protein
MSTRSPVDEGGNLLGTHVKPNTDVRLFSTFAPIVFSAFRDAGIVYIGSGWPGGGFRVLRFSDSYHVEPDIDIDFIQ